MITYLKRGLWYANNFEWIFIAAAALLMEHSAFLYWNFLLHIFPCTKRKFPAASLKGAPQKSTTFKGHEDWELRVKREKQIAHICSDDDAKKCLLINLIMVINCHQIPLWVGLARTAQAEYHQAGGAPRRDQNEWLLNCLASQKNCPFPLDILFREVNDNLFYLILAQPSW